MVLPQLLTAQLFGHLLGKKQLFGISLTIQVSQSCWILRYLPKELWLLAVIHFRLEYIPDGMLKKFLIMNSRKRLAFRVVVQLALDLARGLSYLHSKTIVHRDVKAENMLLHTDRTLVYMAP